MDVCEGMSHAILQILVDFKAVVRTEFITFDHARRTGQKVRKLTQLSSAENT